MKITNLFGPQRCIVCKRTKPQVIKEQLGERKNCGHEMCSFREEINAELIKSNLIIRKFEVDQILVPSGRLIIIDWEILNGKKHLLYINSQTIPIDTSGSWSLNPIKDTSIYIKVWDETGNYYVQSEIKKIRIQQPVEINFESDKICCLENSKIKLSWEIKNATKVSIQPNIGEVKSKGSRTFSLDESKSFVISAQNDFEVKSKQVKIVVFNRPELEKFALPKFSGFSNIPLTPRHKNVKPKIVINAPERTFSVLKMYKKLFGKH